jgi:hypothetical protein
LQQRHLHHLLVLAIVLWLRLLGHPLNMTHLLLALSAAIADFGALLLVVL